MILFNSILLLTQLTLQARMVQRWRQSSLHQAKDQTGLKKSHTQTRKLSVMEALELFFKQNSATLVSSSPSRRSCKTKDLRWVGSGNCFLEEFEINFMRFYYPQNRELQIMRRLEHCNIVKLKYFFYSSGEKVSRTDVNHFIVVYLIYSRFYIVFMSI